MAETIKDSEYLWHDVPVGTLCWHIHHDRLLEVSTEPLRDRAVFIRAEKPAHEITIRLERMRPVRGTLPQAVTEARKAYGEAWKAYDEAWKAYGEAGEACDEAGKAYSTEIEALHRDECPNCPWDGKTIFPKSSSS